MTPRDSVQHMVDDVVIPDVGARADRPPAAQAALLDHVCSVALRLLSDAPRSPRNLRVRVGDVSMDVEWPDQPPVTAGSEPEAVLVEAPDSEGEASGGYLTAQTVGVFYRAPKPESAPFVGEGDAVVVGQQVGIIEAMKMMLPVEADRAGRISAVLAHDAQPVQFGDRLFALDAVDPA